MSESHTTDRRTIHLVLQILGSLSTLAMVVASALAIIGRAAATWSPFLAASVTFAGIVGGSLINTRSNVVPPPYPPPGEPL